MVLTAIKRNFLRVSAQMYNLDKQKTHACLQYVCVLNHLLNRKMNAVKMMEDRNRNRKPMCGGQAKRLANIPMRIFERPSADALQEEFANHLMLHVLETILW